MPSYSTYPKFFVSVDCAIFGFVDGRLKILVHERPYNPAKGELSLIGGFVDKDESLEKAARRILKEFTGLDNVYMQQLSAFGEVERDPGERVISIVYYVLINVAEHEDTLSIQSNSKWIDVDQIPPLCFDHNQMVDKARRVLGDEIKMGPVGKYLMPEYFTLTYLQSLYEGILGQAIDKRNFRRSINEKDYIEATSLIDKDTSKRGATLYRYKNETTV